MKPHKVRLVATNASVGAMLGVCEYCGKTAFYGNSLDSNTQELGDCPNSPDYLSVIGGEIVSLIQRIGTDGSQR